jgi:transcriptional regulator with XRE-family HTH domain
MAFGDILKSLREKAGLSQSELSRMTGVSQRSISGYEAGSNSPSWENVQKLAAALNVSVAAFDVEPASPRPMGKRK